MNVPQEKGDLKFGWVLAAIVVLGVAASQCSEDNDGQTSTTAVPDNTLVALPAEANPAALFPLDASAIQRGAAQFRLIASSQISGGSKIFSENCFESVSKSFNSHKLDRCSGFDMMAVRAIERDESTFTPAELEYFQPETVAGRYLGSLTSAGEAAEKADLRFAKLSQLAAKARLPNSALKTQLDASPNEAVPVGDDVVGNTDAGVEDIDEPSGETLDI